MVSVYLFDVWTIIISSHYVFVMTLSVLLYMHL